MKRLRRFWLFEVQWRATALACWLWCQFVGHVWTDTRQVEIGRFWEERRIWDSSRCARCTMNFASHGMPHAPPHRGGWRWAFRRLA